MVSDIVRDVLRAKRCRQWVEQDESEGTLGPRPVYTPSTRALGAFRPPAQLVLPQEAAYDFLRDPADPSSLSCLSQSEMWELFDAAAAGHLRHCSRSQIEWHARLDIIALWEPYRRLEAALCHPLQQALFAPILLAVREELREGAAAFGAARSPSRWPSRQRFLKLMLDDLSMRRYLPAPRAPEKPSFATSCLLGASCTTLVLFAFDQAHDQSEAPHVYMGMAAAFALLSAFVFATARS